MTRGRFGRFAAWLPVIAAAILLASGAPAHADATATVSNSNGGRCLDADLDGVGSNGTFIQLWDCNSTLQQLWEFHPGPTATVGTLRNVAGNRCLDADLATIRRNGTRVQLWDCNGSQQQMWSLVVQHEFGGTFASPVTKRIKSAYSGRCLDADTATGGRNGTRVQLWDCQFWMFGGQQIWVSDFFAGIPAAPLAGHATSGH